tara:strand:+ start:99780 stop:100775 length:996 start_codon:yes stop_codon:yes gene_type:complete
MKLFLIIFAFPFFAVDASDPDYTKLYKEMRKGILAKGYGSIPAKLWEEVSNFNKAGEKWCFVGDSGVATKAQQKVKGELIDGEKCNRIFHLGDLVYPIGIKSIRDPALKTRFLDYHSPFKVPYYIVMGDHEYYAQLVSPWLKVAQENQNLEFPFYFYGKKFGGGCVIAADTTIFYRGKPGDPKIKEQLDWFKNYIQPRLNNCKTKILIAHHSYATMNEKRRPPKKEYKKQLRNFFEKFVLGKFDLILSGHDHALAYVGNFKGTEQYITGAGGKYTKASDMRMDFKNHIGHKGPGLITLDISKFDSLKMNLSILALEGDNLDKKRIIFSKKY